MPAMTDIHYAQKSQDIFVHITGSDRDGMMLQGEIHPSVIVWLVVFAINFLILRRGIWVGRKL